MKNRMISFLILIMFMMTACSYEEECGACFTPPNYFAFNLTDKGTGENVFTSGRFKPDDIEILDASDHRVEFNFIDEDNINLIEIYTIGWQTEIVNYSINIGSENIFDLYVDAERLSEDCCSFTRYKKIEIDNAEYSLNPDTGIYSILIK